MGDKLLPMPESLCDFTSSKTQHEHWKWQSNCKPLGQMWAKALALINPASRMPPVGPHQTSTPLPSTSLALPTQVHHDYFLRCSQEKVSFYLKQQINQENSPTNNILTKDSLGISESSPGAMKTMSLKEVSTAISYIESINSDTGVASYLLSDWIWGQFHRQELMSGSVNLVKNPLLERSSAVGGNHLLPLY